MSKLIGLEREFFIIDVSRFCGGNLTRGPIWERWFDSRSPKELANHVLTAADVNLSGYQCDECGFLAEARGKPGSTIAEAFFNLKLAEHSLAKLVKDCVLVPINAIRIPAKRMHHIQRAFGKGAAQDECMYGGIKAKTRSTAGLHIHFSNEYNIKCKCGEVHRAKQVLNIPRIIRHLDTAFADTIKRAWRQRGVYEIKAHGFEYRSLPTSLGDDLAALESGFDGLIW